MNNIVDTVEDRIQNAILAAIDNIVAPKIELAIRSINASSGRDVASGCANSERRERTGINISFENASENNNTIGVTSINDEARRNSQDGVSELSVPGTQFDRQSHIHHVVTGGSEQVHNPHHKMKELSNETHHMVTGGSEQVHNPHHKMKELSNETHHRYTNHNSGGRTNGSSDEEIRSFVVFICRNFNLPWANWKFRLEMTLWSGSGWWDPPMN